MSEGSADPRLSQAVSPATEILLVDDERPILNAMQRALRAGWPCAWPICSSLGNRARQAVLSALLPSTSLRDTIVTSQTCSGKSRVLNSETPRGSPSDPTRQTVSCRWSP